MTSIRFRRGNKADMPVSAPSGMPLWCEDTKELYLGTGDDVHLIGGSSSGNSGSYLTPYSVNYGNVDANGYVDLIQKISETEISFKVGGVYPNMGITFPNGRHYVISSIPNITDIIDNTIYTFVIFEENLTDNGNGTYSAVVTPFKLNYPYINYKEDNILSGFTSNTKGGITLSASHSSGSAYLVADDNDGTMWPGAGHQTLCGNPYPFVPGGGGAVNFYVTFATPRKLWKTQILQGYTWSASGKLYISEDNGATWIDTGGISGGNGSFYTKEFKNFSQYSVNKAWFNFTGGTSWHSAGGDCGTCGMDTYTIKLFEAEELLINGGIITEDIVLPANPSNGDLALLINQNPLQPLSRENDAWVEKQFVKIGQAQKLSDLLGTPISYAFNGYYETLITDFPNVSTRTSCNSNIGSTNIISEVHAVNKIAQNGYSEGDVTKLIKLNDSSHASNIDWTKNTIIYTQNSIMPSIINKSSPGNTFTLSQANWSLKIRVKRGF